MWVKSLIYLKHHPWPNSFTVELYFCSQLFSTIQLYHTYITSFTCHFLLNTLLVELNGAEAVEMFNKASKTQFLFNTKPWSQWDGLECDRSIKHLHYRKKWNVHLCEIMTYSSSSTTESESSDITQSRRTHGEVSETHTFIYCLLPQSKDNGNEDDCPVSGENRWSLQTWLNCESSQRLKRRTTHCC